MHYAHALDYATFTYRQLGDSEKARKTLERVEEADPVGASSWGIAAARARYYVERADWVGAASLEPDYPEALPWEEFPAEQVIICKPALRILTSH